MIRINVYDIEAEKIEQIADANDVNTADVIQALFDAIEAEKIDINDYL